MLMKPSENWETRFLDTTMLAEDMGIKDILSHHPDSDKFVPRPFRFEQLFDIGICDG